MIPATLLWAASLAAPAHEPDGLRMFAIASPKLEWTRPESGPQTAEFVSGPIEPGFAWNELVVSWNLEGGRQVALECYATPLSDALPLRRYALGRWSSEPNLPRESVKGQDDDQAKVDTDTLILKKAGGQVVLSVSLRADSTVAPPKLKLLTLSFRNSAVTSSSEAPDETIWGKVIEVPRRSQMSYPGGNVLCSPTCVSMILSHWAKVLGRPEIDHDVPAVQQGVYDPNWPGTGNWPFNTAFAGAIPGMRGYVARLGSIRELEDWIAAGIPVATSVSSAMLKGKPKEPNDGHLVVLVGFDKGGNPVFNDPGRAVEIRQTYWREHFEKAWSTSGRTVYLIYPESKSVPANRLGHWVD